MTTEAIKSKEDIETIKEYFLQNGRIRDYALFSLGINSGINISRLTELKWGDVCDKQTGGFLSFINIKNKSNSKELRIALNENCKNALQKLLNSKGKAPAPADYIFESRNGGPITRFRAFKIIKHAVEKCGIEGNISCQSMKKTLVYYAYKEGVHPEFFMNFCTETDVREIKMYSDFEVENKASCIMPEL